MPDDPHESSFMTAAEHQVDRLVRAARWSRIAICVLIVAVLGLGFLYWQQHDLIRRLNGVNITNCVAGNSFRSGDLQNWELFIQVALGAHPTKDARSKAAEILQGVSQRDTPRDCSHLASS